MFLHMYIAQGQGQTTLRTKFLQEHKAVIDSIIFMTFHPDIFNKPHRDILNTDTYAKVELNPLLNA